MPPGQQNQYGGYGSPLGQFLGGMFGNSGAPYQDFWNQYQKYAQQGINAQNPFYNAGTGALGNYQNWLGGMQDPSGFINKLMSQYQQSPWARNETNMAQNAANNAASASGTLGSTPFAQQSAQNAANISSQDMQNWLSQVLGINNQYGAGQFGLAGMGQGAANQIGNMYGQMATNAGQAAYGQQAGQNQDFGNMLGGALGAVTNGIFGGLGL